MEYIHPRFYIVQKAELELTQVVLEMVSDGRRRGGPEIGEGNMPFEPKPAFEIIQETANQECEEIGRRLYEKFYEFFPKEIVTQSVASAVSLIGFSLIGATYETLKKAKSEENAGEWLGSMLQDIGMVLGHSGLDFKFTLKRKGEIPTA